MKFYGPICVEDADRAELETYMSSGVSPEQQQRVLEQVQLLSMQQSSGPWHKADPLERRPPKPPPSDAVAVPKQRQRMP
ncbi:g8865 [Coccomyxa elongata]